MHPDRQIPYRLMKKYPAIATVEFQDIAMGTFTADAMVKKSPIAAIRYGTISPGRFLVLVGGSTAAVEESYNEALFVGRESILDHVFLPDVHPDLHDGLIKSRRMKTGSESLAVLETLTVSTNIRAAELALKATPIDLVEIRYGDDLLQGKGVCIFHGPLHDLQASMDQATGWLTEKNCTFSHRIISAPHESIGQGIDAGTRFDEATLLDLGGEKG